MTEPRYVLLAAELRRRIARGDLEVGDPIPSEAALAEEFGSSRGTVRNALAALRADGLIDGGRGRPPVVRSGALPQRFETFMSFSRFAAEIGHAPGQRTLELARRPASPAAVTALDLSAGDLVVEVLRLRLLDGLPTMVERSSFPLEVGQHLVDFDTDNGSIYAHLISCGVDLYAARHAIDAVAADSVDAELLDVPPGSPLLRECRRVVSRSGVALEYAEDTYRPDRVTFTIDNTSSSRPAVVRELGGVRAFASLPHPPTHPEDAP